MKPLDKYIRSNPERFDTEEPLPGHFGRFDERLEKTFRRIVPQGWSLALKIAAVVVLGLVLSYIAISGSRLVNRNISYIVSDSDFPELREAERYYTMQMDMYYSAFENLRFENDMAQKKQILNELSEMDRQVMTLKHDLMQNPEDERVVHAIINHFQLKLEFMDMIITRTQESNHTIL